MFDVNILSIIVDIHDISVLIKYFFPVETCSDRICMKESENVCVKTNKYFLEVLQHHSIHVTGNTYVMADLWHGSPAG